MAADSRSYSLSAYTALLKSNRNFRLLWLAQIVSEMGDWLYVVAIYSLLLEVTGRAESVGLAVVLQLLPQVITAPTAGVLNDRLSRRSIMIFADVVRIFIVLAMLFVRGAEMVWLVYTLLFLETVMWALFEPGRSAIVPNIARNKEEILVANALSSTTWAVNFAIGSGIGGLVAYHFGRPALFVMNACSFVISALLLTSIRFRETHAENMPAFHIKELVDFKPIWEGIQYIRRDGRMIATLLVKAGMGLLGAHWVLLPLYGERIFPLPGPGGGALSMSLLLGSRGVGALIGSFSSGYWAKNQPKRMRTGIFFAFLIGASAYCLLSMAPTLPIACAAVAMGHAGTSIAWVFSTTMLQSTTEDKFRGRVFSADFAGLFLVMSALSYTASRLVDWGVPVRTIALGTGLLGLLPAAAWLFSLRLWKHGEIPLESKVEPASRPS